MYAYVSIYLYIERGGEFASRLSPELRVIGEAIKKWHFCKLCYYHIINITNSLLVQFFLLKSPGWNSIINSSIQPPVHLRFASRSPFTLKPPSFLLSLPLLCLFLNHFCRGVGGEIHIRHLFHFTGELPECNKKHRGDKSNMTIYETLNHDLS